MDFEIKAAKQKWEREQKEKKDRARAHLEQVRKEKLEAARQQEAIETAQRLRRLEAAQAEAEAQLQEEQDRLAGDGVRFNKVLVGVQIPGDGGKIILPASAFEDLSSQNALDKGPMFFEVSVASSGGSRATTHCGVLEFTAAEGQVGLPRHVWKNAGLEASTSSPQVRVRYVRLRKGTYAKLQAEGQDFAEVPNHKAVLETNLRQHATLSEGDVLSIFFSDVEYVLRVLELKPASSVSVLETDIEVDVVSTVSDGSSSSQSNLVPVTIGKEEAGTVQEGSHKYFKFSVDEHLAAAVRKGEVEVTVQLQVDGTGGSDADLYVASHPLLFPSRDRHHWASHEAGTKFIRMPETLEEGTFSIAVFGYRGVSRFLLIVEAKSAGERTSGQRVGTASSSDQSGAGYDRCSNCKQMIPSRTIVLHEAYCRRHNSVCQHPGCGVVLRKDEAGQHVHCSKCGQALREDELEKHKRVYHEPLSCSCGAVLEMQEMVKHKASSCAHRSITCQFCGDIVQAGGQAVDARDRLAGLSQHESSCGSRTDACHICRRSVMLKEMSLHIAAAHAPSSPARPSPLLGVEPGTRGAAASQRSEGLGAEQQMSSHLDSARFAAEATLAASASDQAAAACPVCGQTIEGGPEAVTSHLEDAHFSSAAAGRAGAAGGGAAAAAGTARGRTQRSLSVLCPICGMAVHSERDLSSHIDLVH